MTCVFPVSIGSDWATPFWQVVNLEVEGFRVD